MAPAIAPTKKRKNALLPKEARTTWLSVPPLSISLVTSSAKAYLQIGARQPPNPRLLGPERRRSARLNPFTAAHFSASLKNLIGGICMRKPVLVALLACSTAAVARGPVVSTPSGQPEAVFNGLNLTDAQGKIASACMDKGWQVTSQATNQVTCQLPFGGFKQALAGALLGNAYSTPPNVYAQFNMAQINSDVRVQARAWMETQMALGQTRTMAYDDNKSKTGLMAFLVSAGGQLPNGTILNSNQAWMGEVATPGDTTVQHVRYVLTNSPAQKAGLQAGDAITAINGKDFKDDAELSKRLEKVKDATYTITVLRNGQPLTLTLERRTSPAVGTPEYKAVLAETAAFKATHP